MQKPRQVQTRLPLVPRLFLGPEVGRNRAGEEAAGPSSLQKAGQSRLAQRGQRVMDTGDDRWI